MSVREAKQELVKVISDIVERTVLLEHDWDKFMYELDLVVDLFCDSLKIDVYELYERFPLIQSFYSVSLSLSDFSEFIKLLMNLSLFPGTSNYTKLYEFYNNEFYPRAYFIVSDFDDLSTYIKNNSDIEPYSTAVLYLDSMERHITNFATHLSDINSLISSLQTVVNSFISSLGGGTKYSGTTYRKSGYRGGRSGYKKYGGSKKYSSYRRRR